MFALTIKKVVTEPASLLVPRSIPRMECGVFAVSCLTRVVAASEIELADSSRRRVALLRKRKELLRKIRHKQALLRRLEVEQERARSWLAEHVAPIWDDCRRVNDEVLAAFDALLASGHSKRARRSVRDVYRALLARGILTPREEPSSPETSLDADEACDDRPENSPGNEAELRARFRRVALALHPDRVQEEGEKERRTELMKDVTRAFESRDLAGLLRIEQSFAEPGGDRGGARETDVAVLVRLVEELTTQLAAVRKRCQELEDDSVLQFYEDASAQETRGGRTGLDRLVATARADLDELTRVRDVVLSFVRKEITLEQFLLGPTFQFDGAEFDLDDLVRSSLAEYEKPRRRRERGRR